jgi:uncharacterized CHY-type Zn-finger protein
MFTSCFKTEQDFTLIEHNEKPIRDQKRLNIPCGVCHDRATGVHYGLATCEGCKGL